MPPPGTYGAMTLVDLPDEVLQVICKGFNSIGKSAMPVSRRLLHATLHSLKVARTITLDRNFQDELSRYQLLVQGVGADQAALQVTAFQDCFFQGQQQQPIRMLQLLTECSWLARLTLRLLNVDKVSNLSNLKWLTLYSCNVLIDLSDLPQLQWLRLDSCNNIKVVAGLPKLVFLSLKDCKNMTTVDELPQLQQLDVSSCPLLAPIAVTGIPQSQTLKVHGLYGTRHSAPGWASVSGLLSLRNLRLDFLEELTSIDNLPVLQFLSIYSCTQLSSISSLPLLKDAHLSKVPALQVLNLPLTLQHIRICDASLQLSPAVQWPALQRAEFCSCSQLQSVCNLPVLQQLQIEECAAVKEISHLPTLRSLHSSGTDTLSVISHLPLLKVLSVDSKCDLSISDLVTLESLQSRSPSLCLSSIPALTSLTNMGDIGTSISEIPSLQRLTIINGTAECFSNHPHLKELFFEACPHLRSVSNLPNLRQLWARYCPCLDLLTDLPLLEQLDVDRCYKCIWGVVGSCNTSISHSLQVLSVRNMPELTKITNLQSLQKLTVASCKQLTCIADNPSIQELHLESNELHAITGLPVASQPATSCLAHTSDSGTAIALTGMAGLQRLTLDDCHQLSMVADLPALQYLQFRRCHKLRSLHGLPMLQDLSAMNCIRLSQVQGLPLLQKLSLVQCPSVTCLSNMPQLQDLRLNECAVTTFVSLASLSKLRLEDCKKLTMLCDLPELRELHLYDCSALKSLENPPLLEEVSMHGQSGCCSILLSTLPCLRKTTISVQGVVTLNHGPNM